MQEDYKSNSHKSHEQELHDPMPEKRTEKVVTGEVKTRKANGAGKLLSMFIQDDIRNVKKYIVEDVVAPSVSSAVVDIVCSSVKMLLGAGDARSDNVPGRKVAYSKRYGGSDRREAPRTRASAGYRYDDVIFGSRGDAEEVLYRMEELLAEFDAVSVADLFDLAGISCNYTDNKYGWIDLRDVRVTRTRDGYILDLPKPIAL